MRILTALILLADFAIFFFILIKGLLFLWQGNGGYIPFWGCAMVCTAVFWKMLDKESAFVKPVMRVWKKTP